MSNLWSENTPQKFWLCEPDPPDSIWTDAIQAAIPVLDLSDPRSGNIEDILQSTLGEGQFGPGHWRLNLPKRAYYSIKHLLPRAIIRIMRRIYQRSQKTESGLQWPIEDRYVSFLWEVLTQIVQADPRQQTLIRSLWPDNQHFAFVLTHDVETKAGLDYVSRVADLEESLGFRSSFNFVPEAYRVDTNLLEDLKHRGFEIGIHGLKHDGKLFGSKAEFSRRASKINEYLKRFEMVGFRAPLTHRNPEWMQELEIKYDLSFFDTDPFEPISGGTMSIWPFFVGHFIELPYTLVQDYSLTSVLGETSPKMWLDKVDFIEKYHGMALLNSHPDYLKSRRTWNVYYEFLNAMKNRGGYWHSLPHEVASWWRMRAFNAPDDFMKNRGYFVYACLNKGKLDINNIAI